MRTVIATEDTPFFDFCRELPDDLAQEDSNRALYASADLHVMGRMAYQGMSAYFPTATDHPYADLLNAARKIVFSRTLTSADWANSTVARGDLKTELDALKRGGDGTIVAHGGIGFWKLRAGLTSQPVTTSQTRQRRSGPAQPWRSADRRARRPRSRHRPA
jgi:hypothetical protein